MTAPAPLEAVYEGSNISKLRELVQPLLPPGIPFLLGAGAASAHVNGPPRVVITGPLPKQSYEQPRQQPAGGRALMQKNQRYSLEIWGRTLKEAEAIEDAIVNALVAELSEIWAIEMGEADHDGGKQGESSWAITIPIVLGIPIFQVRYDRARIATAGVHGTLVKQLDPPDPDAEPIPGVP